jgi:hypothetical protein
MAQNDISHTDLLARAADAVDEARDLVRASKLLRELLAYYRSATMERAFVERAIRLRDPN